MQLQEVENISIYIKVEAVTAVPEAMKEAMAEDREKIWTLIRAALSRSEDNIIALHSHLATPAIADWLCLDDYIAFLSSDLSNSSCSEGLRISAEGTFHQLISLQSCSSLIAQQLQGHFEGRALYRDSLTNCLLQVYRRANAAVTAAQATNVEDKMKANTTLIRATLSKNKELKTFLFVVRWSRVNGVIVPYVNDFEDILMRSMELVKVPKAKTGENKDKKRNGKKNGKERVIEESKNDDGERGNIVDSESTVSHVGLLLCATFKILALKMDTSSSPSLLLHRYDLWWPLVSVYMRYHLLKLGTACAYEEIDDNSIESGREYVLVMIQDFLQVFTRVRQSAEPIGDTYFLSSGELSMHLNIINESLKANEKDEEEEITKLIGTWLVLLLKLLDSKKTLKLLRAAMSEDGPKLFPILRRILKIPYFKCAHLYFKAVETLVDSIFCRDRVFLAQVFEKYPQVINSLLRSLRPFMVGDEREKKNLAEGEEIVHTTVDMYQSVAATIRKMCVASWPRTKYLLATKVDESRYTLAASDFLCSTKNHIMELFNTKTEDSLKLESLVAGMLHENGEGIIGMSRSLIAIEAVCGMIKGDINLVEIRQSGLHGQNRILYAHEEDFKYLEIEKKDGFARKCVIFLGNAFKTFSCVRRRIADSVITANIPENCAKMLRVQCQLCYGELHVAWRALVNTLVSSVHVSLPRRRAQKQTQSTQGSAFHHTNGGIEPVLQERDDVAEAVCQEVTILFWQIWTETFSLTTLSQDMVDDFFAYRQLFLEAYWWLIFKFSAFSLVHELKISGQHLLTSFPVPKCVNFTLTCPDRVETMWFAVSTTLVHFNETQNSDLLLSVVKACKRGISDNCATLGSQLHHCLQDWLCAVLEARHASRNAAIDTTMQGSAIGTTNIATLVKRRETISPQDAKTMKYLGVLWWSLFDGYSKAFPWGQFNYLPQHTLDDFAGGQRRLFTHVLRLALQGECIGPWLDDISSEDLFEMLKYWVKGEERRVTYSLGDFLAKEIVFIVVDVDLLLEPTQFWTELKLRLDLVRAFMQVIDSLEAPSHRKDLQTYVSIHFLCLIDMWARGIDSSLGANVSSIMAIPEFFVESMKAMSDVIIFDNAQKSKKVGSSCFIYNMFEDEDTIEVQVLDDTHNFVEDRKSKKGASNENMTLISDNSSPYPCFGSFGVSPVVSASEACDSISHMMKAANRDKENSPTIPVVENRSSSYVFSFVVKVLAAGLTSILCSMSIPLNQQVHIEAAERLATDLLTSVQRLAVVLRETGESVKVSMLIENCQNLARCCANEKKRTPLLVQCALEFIHSVLLPWEKNSNQGAKRSHEVDINDSASAVKRTKEEKKLSRGDIMYSQTQE